MFVSALPRENTTSKISLFYPMRYDFLIYITNTSSEHVNTVHQSTTENLTLKKKNILLKYTDILTINEARTRKQQSQHSLKLSSSY